MKGSFVKFFYAVLMLFLFHIRSNWATQDVEVKSIEREKKALLMFKQGIPLDFGGMLSTWRDDENGDCCNWRGVHCSNETGHVQILNLRGSYDRKYYLRGIINISLLIELHDIKHLDLSYNDLDGSDIPEIMGSFSSLKYLNLSYSYFGGNIPSQLGRLSNLRYLDLSYNYYLYGSIPHQLGNLSKLQYLNLGRNPLSGVIPCSLGNLSLLHSLKLGGNSDLKMHNQNNSDAEWLSKLSLLTILDLSEVNDLDLQQVIGKLSPKLRELRLQDCDLPLSHSSLNISTSLVILDLSYNNLTSAMFQWISNLINSNLRELYLRDCILPTNNLAFPSYFFNSSSLVILDLSRNNLTSAMFQWVSNLINSNLRELYLSSCILPTNNLDFPSYYFNSSSLVLLDLSSNNLTSAMFQWVSNLINSNLRELYLSSCILPTNNLAFPSYYFNSSSLVILDLSSNNLTSAMFQWVSNLINSNLRKLYLSSCILPTNNLAFPSYYFNSSSLVFLDLSNNHLTSPTIFHWVSNFTFNLHELQLVGNLLEGPIPDGFGNTMNSLQHLHLSDNKLQGRIPSSLGNISTLQTLSLSNNNLSGQLSAFNLNSSCGNRQALRSLRLSDNQISGMLPDLAIFSSLEVLDLSNNQLIGEIPESIGLLSKLNYLSLNGNSLEGVITESHFTNLSNLMELHLDDNSLALKVSTTWVPPFQLISLGLASCMLGPNFPNWLQTQSYLDNLDISNAQILDSVPEWFWSISENMQFINISYNHFAGTIPNLALKLNYMPRIFMTSNNFEGAIPSFLLQASALHLSYNKFSDLIPFLCGKIKDENLGILDLSNNLLFGQLPDCWGNISSLTYVDLSNNNLSGKIPPSMGSLVNMEALSLRNNSLMGELPSSLMNCTKLLLLDLSKNKLIGPIPSWIGEYLGQLKILSFRMNQFSGSIPLQLCHLAQIQLLDLSQNNLSKRIPPCFNNFTVMAQTSIIPTEMSYHGYEYNVTGHRIYDASFQFYIALMWKGRDDMFKSPESLLKSIDLSSNALTGEIPIEIVSLYGLVSLNLSRNNLSGEIPSEIGNLESLEFLDFSRNHLSGKIPSSLAHIDRLSTLDLSCNILSRKIPTGTQLQSFNASSYEGNWDLCGMPLDNKCPDETPSPRVSDEEDDDSLLSQEFYMSLGLGFAVGFWAFLGPILFNRSWRATYYRLVNKVLDNVYIKVAVYVASCRRIRD